MKSLLSRIEFAASCHDDYGAPKEAVSSGNGKVTEYAYDAAGRMTREGAKTYRYGYLDKVLSVAEGKDRRTFTYHVDGQLATATRTGGPRSVAAKTGSAASPLAAETETFLWDGLALIRRGTTAYVNEPHPGNAPKKHCFERKPRTKRSARRDRNYRAGLGKWQTADPLGYPDGWNQMAYCGNDVALSFDLLGALTFGTYDYFYPSYSISHVSAISVIRGSGGDAEGGACIKSLEKSINYVDKALSIKFLIGIRISPNARYSSSFDVNSQIEYGEHGNGANDSYFYGGLVYEAVLAHERGHASYALNTTASLLRIRLAAFEVAWQGGQYNDNQIDTAINSIFVEVSAMGWAGSGQAANNATINFFTKANEWEQIYHGNRVWRWKKKSIE